MMTFSETILLKAKQIRLMIFDVDGVLTDRNIYLSDQGHEYKAFNTHDGFGIKMLLKNGIEVGVITARNSSIVQKRMDELGVKHVFQGQENKLKAYEALIKNLALQNEQVGYVGDDLPDVPIMRRVGLSIAVADAVDFVKHHAHWQTTLKGGKGAVRETCDLILLAQNQLQPLYEQYL